MKTLLIVLAALLALALLLLLSFLAFPLWTVDRFARRWGRKLADTYHGGGEVQLRQAPAFIERFLSPRTIAITLGNTILFRAPTYTRPLLAHELVHVDQWRAHPRTFPIRYLIAHRHGWAHNRYEQEANNVERAVRARGGVT